MSTVYGDLPRHLICKSQDLTVQPVTDQLKPHSSGQRRSGMLVDGLSASRVWSSGDSRCVKTSGATWTKIVLSEGARQTNEASLSRIAGCRLGTSGTEFACRRG